MAKKGKAIMNVRPGRLLLVVLFGALIPHFRPGAHFFASHSLLYKVQTAGTVTTSTYFLAEATQVLAFIGQTSSIFET